MPTKDPKKRKHHQLMYNFGITLEQYQKMFDDQEGLCQGCNLPPGKKHFSVDHSHQTGRIRGLLCNNCNTAVGYAKDNPDILRQLAKYLERT